MKPGYFVSLSLTFFIAGCSASAQHRHTKALHSLDGRQKMASVKTASASAPHTGQDLQLHLSDFLNLPLRDTSGNEVGRLKDLTVGVNGRVISVTLLSAKQGGGKLTIPFEWLKVEQGQQGALYLAYLETDVVLKPDRENAATGTNEKAPPNSAAPEQKSGDGALKEPENKPQ
jgi:sporulation protein YlmC with PRC-barrel domain